MNQSALATKEFTNIIQHRYDARTKTRFVISAQFLLKGFRYMANDVLTCDDDKLQSYANIAFYYNPSESLVTLFKEARIYNYAECGSCHDICSPVYLYGDKEPLCKRCAREILN